jgi:hypothetical protein
MTFGHHCLKRRLASDLRWLVLHVPRVDYVVRDRQTGQAAGKTRPAIREVETRTAPELSFVFAGSTPRCRWRVQAPQLLEAWVQTTPANVERQPKRDAAPNVALHPPFRIIALGTYANLYGQSAAAISVPIPGETDRA